MWSWYTSYAHRTCTVIRTLAYKLVRLSERLHWKIRRYRPSWHWYHLVISERLPFESTILPRDIGTKTLRRSLVYSQATWTADCLLRPSYMSYAMFKSIAEVKRKRKMHLGIWLALLSYLRQEVSQSASCSAYCERYIACCARTYEVFAGDKTANAAICHMQLSFGHRCSLKSPKSFALLLYTCLCWYELCAEVFI